MSQESVYQNIQFSSYELGEEGGCREDPDIPTAEEPRDAFGLNPGKNKNRISVKRQSCSDRRVSLFFWVLLGLGVCLVLIILMVGAAEISAAVSEIHKMRFGAMAQNQLNMTSQLQSHQKNTAEGLAEMKDRVSAISLLVNQSSKNLLEQLSQIRNVTAQLETQQGRLIDQLSKLKDLGRNLCLPGWRSFSDKCYYFLTDSLAWQHTRDSCSQRQAQLVVINTADEQVFVTTNSCSDNWIGLNDIVTEGQWQWVDGTNYASTPKYWRSGEPNNANNEDCAYLTVEGQWNDAICDLMKTGICERSQLASEQ